MKEKSNRGRKSKYDYYLCVEICDKIADGEAILDILDSDKEKYPAWSTFRRWKRDHEDLRAMYINAIQDKSEPTLHEIDNTLKDLKTGVIDPKTANVLVQTYKWKAAKFYPKMYGERQQLDLEVKDKKLSSEEIKEELGALMQEAKEAGLDIEDV